MIGEVPQQASRERQILCKAIDAFAAHGVRGTGLREIARDAGVSLTLISHHFGSKTSLVSAAAAQLRRTCDPALGRLRTRLEWASALDARQLAEAWFDYLEDAFGSNDTLPQLRLLHRLRSDPSVEPAIRASLDMAEPVIRRALRSAFARAAETSVELVLQASRNVLIEALIDSRAARTDDPVDREAWRASLVDYISAGIAATLAGGRGQEL